MALVMAAVVTKLPTTAVLLTSLAVAVAAVMAVAAAAAAML